MSVYRLSERSGGVIGTIGPIGGSGVFSLQERYALSVDNYDDVSLYLKMNGASGSTTFYDSSQYGHTVTANGNAQISTAVSKFGGASAAFDGTGDYLSVPSDSSLAFGTGDFTVEMWVRASSTPSDVGIFESRTNGLAATENGFTVTAYSLSVIRIYSNGILISSSGTSYVGTWCHVAVTRSSGTWNLFINGVSQGTSATARNLSNTDCIIGAGRYAVDSTPNAFFNGYIDDLRITKGRARWTANFTPPQREFLP